jgi:hypothetical protein
LTQKKKNWVNNIPEYIGTVGVQACRNPPKDAVAIAAKRFKVIE